MLGNFMGMFWLVSGIISLRWGASGERARGWAVLAGAIGGFRVGEGEHRKMSVTGFLLGIFEIILGLILILEPLERGPVLNLAASIWALVGGFILISGALQKRKQKQVQEQRETQENMP